MSRKSRTLPPSPFRRVNSSPEIIRLVVLMYVRFPLWKQRSTLPTTRAGDAQIRRMSTLEKFASVHANVHNHFNLERHLVDRQTHKKRRSAAQAREGRCSRR